MQIIETEIEGVLILKPKIFKDKRGHFMETFKKDFIERNFPEIKFIQENQSRSNFGVLRGLHFQKAPMAQTKLVKAVYGSVLDIVVDLRKSSKTFGKYLPFILSDENNHQLLIPKGFAHGFIVLSEEAIISYLVDNEYSPEHESGINFDDPMLRIDWKVSKDKMILSDKDIQLQSFSDFIVSSQ